MCILDTGETRQGRLTQVSMQIFAQACTGNGYTHDWKISAAEKENFLLFEMTAQKSTSKFYLNVSKKSALRAD